MERYSNLSKEFAQTLGGKKIGLLLILLAAIAVSLGVWQSQIAWQHLTSVVPAHCGDAQLSGNVAAGSTVLHRNSHRKP